MKSSNELCMHRLNKLGPFGPHKSIALVIRFLKFIIFCLNLEL